MSAPFKEYQSLLNERSIIIVVVVVLALMWSVGQLSLMAALVIGTVATVLLIQLEIKRRMETLQMRRATAREQRRSSQQGAMTVRANTLNRLPSPVLLIDDQQSVVFANQAALDLLGSDIIDNDVFLYLRQSAFVTALDAVLTGKPAENATIRYTSSNERSFDVTVAPVPASEDGTAGPQAMVFFYEVTSLLRTEQMRADFVANASHELRTPLTSLIGFIETLQGPAADDTAAHQRFLGIMQREAERMVRLIDDLLSLSRIEMSRHMAPTTTIDLCQHINSAVSTVVGQAEERGIKFSFTAAEGVKKVVADSDQVTQVFLNLLSNAGKYADRDSTVHINATPHHSGRHVLISIRDEGPGIAPEHLARLTERFYRVDTARSRKMGGTGLGLAIVKHILLRHGSQMDIKSQIGKGTVFSFRLPIPGVSAQESSETKL
ncbi:MAG: PAS domain-containing protein [Alphaproteobacteria bacterium]|nr:MAG: PAS domain-containing protein [Alphaproteobacteria bacterium]